MARVERVERVLEDHLQAGNRPVVAPLHGQVCEVDVAKLDLAAGRVLEPHQHFREGRLAAAGFADNGDRLRLVGAERDLLVCLDGLLGAEQQRSAAFDRVVLRQILDAEDDFAGSHRLAIDRFRLGHIPIDLAEAHAAHEVARTRLRLQHRQGNLIAAPGDEVVAARREVAAHRPCMGQRQLAADRDERPRILIGARQRDGVEKATRIGMAHLVEHAAYVAGFHRLAGVHDSKAMAGLENEAEIVRDVDERGAELGGDLLDELDDPRLDRDVESGGRLVEQKQLGLR